MRVVLDTNILISALMVLAPMVLRLARGLLFGVGPLDPVPLATVAVILTAVSLAASAIPALRASRLGR